MDTVTVELEHCYGIKALTHNFDFSQKRAFAIYAPNGAMKSSFAHTFKDLSEGAEPRDRIFPDRHTVAKVTDDKGDPITGDRILVVESYDDKVCPTEKHGALLVEPKLREQYLTLQARVGEAKQELLNRIKAAAKSKTGLESEISSVLANVPDDLRRALNRVKEEVKEQAEAPFANVEWDKVFSESIVALLNTKDLKSQIEEYIERYDELLEKSGDLGFALLGVLQALVGKQHADARLRGDLGDADTHLAGAKDAYFLDFHEETFTLFSDTKIGKNSAEDVVGLRFADEGTHRMERLTKVSGKELVSWGLPRALQVHERRAGRGELLGTREQNLA